MKNNMRKVTIIRGKHQDKVGFFHGSFVYADEYGSCAEAVIEFEDGRCGRFPEDWIQFANPPVRVKWLLGD